MDEFDLSEFLSGNLSDPAAGDVGAVQTQAWGDDPPAQAAPMVSPYPMSGGGGGTDPALMNMMGMGQYTPQPSGGGGQPQGQPAPSGGGGAARPMQQPQIMQTGSGGGQTINYPGLPQSSTTIGQAGQSC